MREFIRKLASNEMFRCLVFGLLVIIGTFPENDWSYDKGIDPPLAWVFNYLFDTGLERGQHIIFPHGPLAFFMYPLPENILVFTVVLSLLKVLLVYSLYRLVSTQGRTPWMTIFITAWLLSLLCSFNHLLLANMLLLYCNYDRHEHPYYKYAAFLLAAFAFYVKAYVAILSGVIFVSFQVYQLIRSKNYRNVLVDSTIQLMLLLLLWILMYGGPGGFPRYIWGMAHLAEDNSSAASLYPDNNWMLLLLFFAGIVALFVINKGRRTAFYGALTGFSLFAAWKHGIAREDIFHMNGFFVYVLTCLAIFLVYVANKLFASLLLVVSTLFIFYMNMENAVNYATPCYEIVRVNNFMQFATGLDGLAAKAASASANRIGLSRLPQAMLDTIGTATTDVYPWDYTIVAANQLNWQPRVVLHSYASYTSWLDQQNAQHFAGPNAPEFIVLERLKELTANGGELGSIDQRYFLNDEPRTILVILAGYDLCLSDPRFFLLKKREKRLTVQTRLLQTTTGKWDTWMQVPKAAQGLVRAKLHFSKSLLQRAKSFFYKDEQFWIYMQLENGPVHKYRIVPKNAEEGLWIDPYCIEPGKWESVEKIMLRSGNKAILTDDITVSWEHISFNGAPNLLRDYFVNGTAEKDTLLVASLNNFENTAPLFWSQPDAASIVSTDKGRSHQLQGTAYSAGFTFPLDSLDFQDLVITADGWLHPGKKVMPGSVSLVFSIDDANGNILWKGIPLHEQVISNDTWNSFFGSTGYPHNRPGCTLKIYLMSNEAAPVLLDDLRISILGKSL